MKLSSLNRVDSIRLLTENKGTLSQVIQDLISKTKGVRWALAGGLAVGFHARPRGTEDVDIIVESEDDVRKLGKLQGFKLIRPHAIEHLATGVEVEILTPQFLKIDPKIVSVALDTSVIKNGIPVVNRSALVALKLQRASYRDKGDIEDIIRHGGPVDLTAFNLSDSQMLIYNDIYLASAEPHIGEQEIKGENNDA